MSTFKVGDKVSSTYGEGKINEIRSDGMLIIVPTKWELANGCIPTFYIMKDPPANTPGVTLVSQPGMHVSFDDNLTVVDVAPVSTAPSAPSIDLSLIDLSIAEEAEVWEKKAEKLASAPELEKGEDESPATPEVSVRLQKCDSILLLREKKNAQIEDSVEASVSDDSAEPAVSGKVKIVKRASQLGNYMEDDASAPAATETGAESVAAEAGEEKKKNKCVVS